jgi:HK97 family phage portal protein
LSFLAKVFGVSRSTGPFRPSDPALATFFGFVPSAAGVNVDEYSALNYTAVWAATRMISEAIASVPLMLFEHESGNRTRAATDHSAYDLLFDEPNPDTSSFTFRESRMAHAVNWGNAYAEIEFNRSGDPVGMWQLEPRNVRPDRDKAGRLVYQVTGTGSNVPVPAERMLHTPGLGFDGLVGYNVIRMAREAIGLGMATERFGATFFGNGAFPGGVLQHPGNPTQAAKEESRRTWEAMHQGPDRAHRTGALWGGITFNKDAGLIPPEEAQFLQTREFSRGEIALWYNLPLMKLGSNKTATYASAEQFAEDFVKHTIRPWAERWENEYRRKLLRRDERKRFFIRHMLDALLRGDLKTRTEARAKQFTNGAINLDEWRQDEDLDPIDGGFGQTHYVPSNIVPIDEPRPTTTPAPPDGEDAEEADDNPNQDQPAPKEKGEEEENTASLPSQLVAQRELMVDALGRLCRKESQTLRRMARNPAAFLRDAEDFLPTSAQDFHRFMLPAMRMHAALIGRPYEASHLTTLESEAWMQQTRDELRKVDRQGGNDGLAGRLENLCGEWERGRASELADRLLHEEMLACR